MGRQFAYGAAYVSQCTCRCVVLPDLRGGTLLATCGLVSMHLQVRGAP